MHKKFLNHHKLQRKLKRRLNDSVTRPVFVSGKDMAWHKSKVNPFYQDPGRFLRILKITILIFAVFGTLGAAMYHPFFRISTINVTGEERISEIEIQKAVEGMLSYRRYFILPANNYFLLDAHELQSLLLARYPFSHVVISATFPHTISVIVQEKLSTVIYDDGKQYSFIGTDGNLVEPIRKVGDDEWVFTTKTTTTTDAKGREVATTEKVPESHAPDCASLKKDVGNYPVILDVRGAEHAPEKPYANPSIIEKVIAWYHAFPASLHTSLTYAIISSNTTDFTLMSQSGWKLYTNADLDVEDQLKTISLISKQRGGLQGLQYIDLRYPERVYWQ